MSKHKIGDYVRLNNCGLNQIYGTTIGLSHIKSKIMQITHVDDQSVTDDEPRFIVHVDDEEINQFIIDDHCFDNASLE